MNPRTRTARWLLPVGAVIAGGALVLSGGLISAQAPSPTDTPSPSNTPGSTNSPDSTPTLVVPGATPESTPGNVQSPPNVKSYDELLADQLGITVEKLRDAETGARDQYFDQLVKSGDLTAEQAASLKASSSDQVITDVVGNNQSGFVRDFVLSQVAKLMNMDSAQLKQELSQGKSLQQIADEQGVTNGDIRSKLESRADQLVNMAKDAGLISSDEASNLNDTIQNIIDKIFGSSGSNATPTGTSTPTDTATPFATPIPSMTP